MRYWWHRLKKCVGQPDRSNCRQCLTALFQTKRWKLRRAKRCTTAVTPPRSLFSDSHPSAATPLSTLRQVMVGLCLLLSLLFFCFFIWFYLVCQNTIGMPLRAALDQQIPGLEAISIRLKTRGISHQPPPHPPALPECVFVQSGPPPPLVAANK